MRLPTCLRPRILFALLSLLAVVSCSKVEGTGRSQFLIYGDAEMDQMGVQAFNEIKKSEKRSHDPVATAMIERVGRRLAAVAPQHGYTYEFLLIESPEINAFCLPGGKVAFYTGILGWCENEAAIAAVMGHEIAHAIARHGNERMSQGVLVQGSQIVLAKALEAKGVSQTTLNLSMAAFGLGAQVGVMLPFSRKHESEADYLGLTYMAKAGYDPEEAVRFWNRFSALTSGTPGFLSTHPASEQRAADLRAHMPEAQALYSQAGAKHGLGEKVPAQYKAVKPQ